MTWPAGRTVGAFPTLRPRLAMPSRPILLSALLFLGSTAVSAPAQQREVSAPAPASPAGNRSEIRTLDLRARIGFLASDALEGRESGKRGGHLAAEFFAKQWRDLGLKPLGEDGSYLLPFSLGELEFWNTAGLLPGTDPALADQILVVGGHHDHCGIGGPGALGPKVLIYNGADDNASGSSGVAELAEWFAAHPLRHPILFMTFSAEERGLLGSENFVKHGPIPTDHMLAMLNFDMIGRAHGKLFLGGMGTAAEFHPLFDPLVAQSGFQTEIGDRGEAPSDNSSFYRAGVPSVFLFTGIHSDYHLPTDDADKIDYDGEVRVLDLARQMLQALDREDGPLTFQKRDGMALPAEFNQRMFLHMQEAQESIAAFRKGRGKMGIRIQENEDGALIVENVREDSPAARAGILVGDRLVEVNRKTVKDFADLRRRLELPRKGDRIYLKIERGGETLDFSFALE